MTISTTSTHDWSSRPARPGIQAIDGPYARVGDDDGLRARSQLARALGLDGKWTIHPGQIAIVNEVFSPAREQWERAEAMLAAYDEAHRSGAGAAVFEGEMIDEANRKMAERIASRGAPRGTSHEQRRAARPPGRRDRDPRDRVLRAAARLRGHRADRRPAHGHADR